MKRFNKKDIFTIPNCISYFRILLIPVICWLYLRAETSADYVIATSVTLFSSFTDLFDGMIARKFNQVTELGKVLDPAADKLTHAALAICLAIKHPLMWALIGLMAVKELYMAIMGIYFLKRDMMINGAQMHGKICTTILFVGLLVLFFFYNIDEIWVNVVICIMMAAMLVSFILYIIMYTKMVKEYKESLKNN